jgi:hypothetical protein
LATVREVCTTEEQNSVVRFLLAKGLDAKDIHKETFPVFGGKCPSRKAFHSCVADVSLTTKRLKTEVRKWVRQQSQDFYAAAIVSVLEEDMSKNKYLFKVRNVLRFISICDLLTDSPS